jgi:hypothetical protein
MKILSMELREASSKARAPRNPKFEEMDRESKGRRDYQMDPNDWPQVERWVQEWNNMFYGADHYKCSL